MDLLIVGWNPGLKTVSLVKLLRDAGDMGLLHAKQAVDDLLAGKEVRVCNLDAAIAQDLRTRAEAMGAVFREE
jgi:ribosomal protein L7/L12